jgi:anhydro-N-acetylmuramic acid kinase
MATALYLGLMSGTSMDGVDAALCAFNGSRLDRIVATHGTSYPASLRARLLQLQRDPTGVALHDYASLDHQVAEIFAATASELLEQHDIARGDVLALGSHGQTIFHDPAGARSSLQLGDPNLIAARTGITTVADFRRRDIASGGQGAPLVPAFHHACFADAHEARCVINIGGIANITVLPDDNPQHVTGFDTGPGNGLMDEWAMHRLGRAYDAQGAWAQSGRVHDDLLQALLADEYFTRPPPKSTGRDKFNLDWAHARFPQLDTLDAADVQSTFCTLTAASITSALRTHANGTRRVLFCGGGVHNQLLLSLLRAGLRPAMVELTDQHGLNAQWVEAAAFAWLAMRTLAGLPGNLPAVTGAAQAAILGGIYQT